MKKGSNAVHTAKYNSDAVLVRGYEIYDEWKKKRFTSRKVVERVEEVVAMMHANGTKDTHLEALSCLFALDMRIAKQYKTLLGCLFFYFSWRREVLALKKLKGELNIPNDVGDVRTAIEVELQKLREQLGDEDSDGDDETHGGKHNGNPETEASVTEAGQQDQISAEANEDIPDAENTEELSEEYTENANEAEESEITEEIEKPEEAEPLESAEEAGEQELEKEASTSDVELKDVQEQLNREDKEFKQENNGAEEKSEPTENTKNQSNTYNDAVDSPPLVEEVATNEKTKGKISFIDEVIIDNMVKGKEDFVTHNPLEDVKSDKNTNRADAVEPHQEKDGVKAEFDEEAPQSEQNSKEANDTSKADVKVNEEASEVKDGTEETRVPIQVDMTVEAENEMIGDLHKSLTEEMVLMLKAGMDVEAREQLRIASEELGIDAPVEIIGKTEFEELEKSHTELNRQ